MVFRLIALFICHAAVAAPVHLALHTDSGIESKTNLTVRLKGADARQQLLATAQLDSGMLADITRQVTYEVAPKGIVKVTATGLMIPLRDGTATVSAQTTNGISSSIKVAVEAFSNVPSVNFANQIVP